MQVSRFKRNKPPSQSLVIATLILTLMFGATLPVFAEDAESIKALRQMGKAFATIAEKASPAVVWVSTERVVEDYSIRRGPFGDPFDKDLFDDFFFHPRRRPRVVPKHKPRRIAQGSGFIITPDGYILTNNHVVKAAEEVNVVLADGRKFKAKIVGTDSGSEVAVIKIDATNLPHLELADSDELEVGEWVLAIGSPFGLRHTVTAGIVSAKGRSRLGLAEYEDFIQTDAAINPGNSGGPLLNLTGKAVGINTAIVGSNRFIGIGLAIPINMAKYAYEQLIDTGTVARGFLGVSIKELEPELAGSLGLEKDAKGIAVAEVIEGSAAEKAGMKRYDVIVEFEGDKVEKANEFRNRVSMLKPGTKVKLVVLRDGKRRPITIELGAKSELASARSEPSESLEELGFVVNNLTDDLADRLGYKGQSGVIVTQVEPGSIADRNGITPGSLIMEVDRKPVKNTREFNNALENAREEGSVLLLIDSGRYRLLIVLPLPEK